MEQPFFVPTVLLFRQRDPVRFARISAYLRAKGIRPLPVESKELHQSIGALLGLPGFERKAGPWIGPETEEEMLVMFAFQGTMMKDFLQFFRDEGLPSVPLKAVATPTNVCWSALELYEELKKERDYFRSQKA